MAGAEENRDEAREQLRESERAISDANRSLRDLRRQLAASRATLESLASRRRKLEAESEAREQDLARLLVSIYRAGEPGYLKLLLSGDDPAQAARNLHYMSHISRAHAALVESLREDVARLAELESQGRESASEIASLEAAERTGREELVRQQSARRKVLQQSAERIRLQQREVKRLEADDARLARLVERISRVMAAPGVRNDAVPERDQGERPFKSLKGLLRLPVRGTVANRFGSSRPDGGPSWKGVFIRSAAGTEIRAVAAGVVVFADWMRGYGNVLILDHGSDYLTIYANSESLLKTVGERVKAGEPVATVGASGGGKESGLYFEARHEGKAFDPMSWVSLR